MTINEHQVWLLHKKPCGDTSVLITVFSHDCGLIKAYFKGGRASKKQALLQPFVPLWLAVDARQNSTYVKSLEQAELPLFFEGDKLLVGLYLNELLYRLLPPVEPYPSLYTAYDSLLKRLPSLKERSSIEPLLRHFEWILLEVTGYGLSLGKTADSREPISPQRRYRFIPGHGLVEQDNGLEGDEILHFIAGDFSLPNVLKTAKHIMRQAITHALDGQPLKVRSLFSQFDASK